MWSLLLLSCWGAQEPVPERGAPHFAEVESLFAAMQHGDLNALHKAAADLDGAPPILNEEAQAASDRLHGALGMATVAEDVSEAADAAAVLSLSCGRCHSASGAPTRFGAASYTSLSGKPLHEAANQGLWWSAIAGDKQAWSAADEAQRRALAELAPQKVLPPTRAIPERVDWELAQAAWLETCVDCHGGR